MFYNLYARASTLKSSINIIITVYPYIRVSVFNRDVICRCNVHKYYNNGITVKQYYNIILQLYKNCESNDVIKLVIPNIIVYNIINTYENSIK